MKQTILQKVISGVMAFITKEEKKLPSILEEAAKFGLKWTNILETALNSQTAIDLSALVPATEPLREEILVILTATEKGFRAVDSAYNKGLLFIGAGKIGQLQVGSDVPLGHVLIAVQAEYLKSNTAS